MPDDPRGLERPTIAVWTRRSAHTLHERGLRMTPQRQLVLDAVRELGHATPEQICAAVQRTAPAVNITTVYRTLDLLEQLGMVQHTHLGHGAPSYSPEKHEHVHLVCHSCGEVTEIDTELLDELAGRLQAELRLPARRRARRRSPAPARNAPTGAVAVRGALRQRDTRPGAHRMTDLPQTDRGGRAGPRRRRAGAPRRSARRAARDGPVGGGGGPVATAACSRSPAPTGCPGCTCWSPSTSPSCPPTPAPRRWCWTRTAGSSTTCVLATRRKPCGWTPSPAGSAS